MTVTGIISAIIVGLIIGALGRLVVPGRQNIPIWLTILIGIAAAIVGTLIANALDVGSTRGVDWIELLLQIVLAALGVMLIAGSYGRGSRRRL
jgi:uncharacterized membrane protein YeaQ/YmgE (transglycosylase-associated protein family)